jgi:predicted naringenin-chalcone synthase
VTIAHINRIATAVPSHDIHHAFIRFARTLIPDERVRSVFDRMAAKAKIEHRFAVFPPAADPEGVSVDAGEVFSRGRFPTTATRMRFYERHAPQLALHAVTQLALGPDIKRVSHVILTSCTGMYAPGIDLELIERLGLPSSVERTHVGFMGCYAAISALKLARHIVRSSPDALVLVVNVELCSIHLQESNDLEQLLSFLLFADGCAASLVSAEPTGLAIDRFHAALVPDTRSLITWSVADQGFDMLLSGGVPAAVTRGLTQLAPAILGDVSPAAIDLWAVHPGGRSVLDAVERGLRLEEDALDASRAVLARYGNMSSPTVMFVLASLLDSASRGQRGCAMSFGPGLTAETMLFNKV